MIVEKQKVIFLYDYFVESFDGSEYFEDWLIYFIVKICIFIVCFRYIFCVNIL